MEKSPVHNNFYTSTFGHHKDWNNFYISLEEQQKLDQQDQEKAQQQKPRPDVKPVPSEPVSREDYFAHLSAALDGITMSIPGAHRPDRDFYAAKLLEERNVPDLTVEAQAVWGRESIPVQMTVPEFLAELVHRDFSDSSGQKHNRGVIAYWTQQIHASLARNNILLAKQHLENIPPLPGLRDEIRAVTGLHRKEIEKTRELVDEAYQHPSA